MTLHTLYSQLEMFRARDILTIAEAVSLVTLPGEESSDSKRQSLRSLAMIAWANDPDKLADYMDVLTRE